MTIRKLDPKAMGKRIRLKREEIGLTREKLAERLDLSSKFIFDVESGLKGISIQNLFLLAQEIHASVDYLLGLKNYNPEEVVEPREVLLDRIMEPLKGCSYEELKVVERWTKFFAEDSLYR